MQTYHSAERLPKEIRLRDMGSFYAGGQKIEISGGSDQPSGGTGSGPVKTGKI